MTLQSFFIFFAKINIFFIKKNIFIIKFNFLQIYFKILKNMVDNDKKNIFYMKP